MQQETSITLPPEVEKRLRHLGAAGAAWRAELPAKVERLQKQWALSLGGVLHGGSGALVIEARNTAADDLVIKLSVPSIAEPGQSEVLDNNELKILQAAEGRGYVLVLEADDETGAMLMPRLGEPLGRIESDPETQQRLLCETLKEAWQVPTAGIDLQTGAQKANWLRSFIVALAEKHPQYISAETLSIAVDFTHCRERAHEQANKVLIHGDPHSLNALHTSSGGYAFIDPDGLFGEPEYDLGVLMREASDELLESNTAPIERGKSRCERLAQLTGTAPLAIWQWGFIERVSTGLYCMELDMPDYGKPSLEVANSWAQQGARQCYGTSS